MTTHTELNPTVKPAPNCILIIMGIAGDLTKRLLYPAICNLGREKLLDPNFTIVGVSVEDYTSDSFREKLAKDVQEFITDPDVNAFGLSLLSQVHYISGDFTDSRTYVALKEKLHSLKNEGKSENCIFYFAAPPQFMLTITQKLSKAQLLDEQGGHCFRRIVVEKPFGHDLTSAKALNHDLLKLITEKQIFRMDHFLGKETVQNIFSLRFSNGLFEPIWNRLYIDNVQITVAETLGIEQRGSYYEQAGAVRDMVPNHLFQMLSLIAMEPPVSFSAEDIQNERIKVLSAIKLLKPEQVLERAVRGQYGAGEINEKEVIAYRAEPHVLPDSHTETYAAFKLYLDNWRWLNVPFYLRTGKRLKARTTQIAVQFKSGPSNLFSTSEHGSTPNLLHIYIQPDEGISLQFNVKKPGRNLQLDEVDMTFKYNDYFGTAPQTGYETILYDCMNGEHLLFQNAVMVETCWSIVQPILDVWGAIEPRDFPNYHAGTWGPKEADELLHKDGREWLL